MVLTRQEILYFERKKAMEDKFFRKKDVRSKYRILLDKEITLKLHDN